jgi:hypothetical protein
LSKKFIGRASLISVILLLAQFALGAIPSASAYYRISTDIGPYNLIFSATSIYSNNNYFHEENKVESYGTEYKISAVLEPARDRNKNGSPYVSLDKYTNCGSFITLKILHNNVPITANLLPEFDVVGGNGTYSTPNNFTLKFGDSGFYSAKFEGYVMCLEKNDSFVKFDYNITHRLAQVLPAVIYPRKLDIESFECPKAFKISVKSKSKNKCVTYVYDPDFVADALSIKIFKASPMFFEKTFRKNSQWVKTIDGWKIETVLDVGYISPNQYNNYRKSETFFGFIEIQDLQIEKSKRFSGTAFPFFIERAFRFEK